MIKEMSFLQLQENHVKRLQSPRETQLISETHPERLVGVRSHDKHPPYLEKKKNLGVNARQAMVAYENAEYHA